VIDWIFARHLHGARAQEAKYQSDDHSRWIMHSGQPSKYTLIDVVLGQ
jgi:hypothetical protein